MLTNLAQYADKCLSILRCAIEQSPAVVVITDTGGTIEYVNTKFTEVSGYTLQEVVGKNPRILKSGRQSAETYQALWKTLQHDGKWQGTLCNRAKNGRPYWVRVSIFAIRDDTHQIMHYVAVQEDVTWQKHLEDRLRFVQFADEHGVDTAFRFDADGRLVHVNDQTCRMLGYSREELLAMSVWQIIGTRSQQPWHRYWTDLKQTKARTSETRFRTKLGQTFPVEVRSHYMAHDGNEYGIAFARDISDAKIQERVLRASTERLNALTRNAGELILELDVDGRVAYVSPNVTELLGSSSSELLGTRILERIHPDDADFTRESIQQTLARGQGQATCRAHHAEKGWRWFECTGSTYCTPEGKMRLLTVARDVTERTQFEDRSRQSQKMEAVGQLAGGVAHEFNNLLQAICGYVQFAMDPDSPADQRNDDLQQVLKAADQAAQLTRQLLRFGRRETMVPREIHPNAILEEQLQLLRPLIGAHIAVQTALEKHACCVSVDPAVLQQVITNLCVNARDAMPAGGTMTLRSENVTIDSGFEEGGSDLAPGDYVRISVEDTGRGIPPESVHQIFEPFFTTKEVGMGTGLGLATTYGAIKQHGGTVRVASQMGHGTRFDIYLPAVAGRTGPPKPSPIVAGRRESMALGSTPCFEMNSPVGHVPDGTQPN